VQRESLLSKAEQMKKASDDEVIRAFLKLLTTPQRFTEGKSPHSDKTKAFHDCERLF